MASAKVKMEGKVCLITGGTSGIGKATAEALAGLGATTIIVGRDPEKSRRVCQKIMAKTRNSDVDFLLADLSSQEDIRKLADLFKRRFPKLGVLINNAGAKMTSRNTTVDGYEMTFALNHLAYFLLTQLLIDRLKAGSDARIINVSSGAHGGARLDFNDLQNEHEYVGKRAYNQSKLANIVFTYELSRRLDGSGVTVNAIAPGGVITHFCRNNGYVSWLKHLGAHILARNLIGPKKAAETIVYLATSAEVQGVTGKYFFEKKPVTSSAASYDADTAKRLWDVSMEMTGLAHSS